MPGGLLSHPHYTPQTHRGSCNGPRDSKYYDVKRFNAMNLNDVEDKTILRFVPRLKSLLGIV